MAEANVSVGDMLTVVLTNDEAPDRSRCLRISPKRSVSTTRRVSCSRASRSRRREYVRSITEAKRADTRARRVERTIRALLEQAPGR